MSVANGTHCHATMMPIDDSGQSAKPVDGAEAERARDEREEPIHRVHQEVLPDQRADRRHHEERRDDQKPRDRPAPEVLVEQHREQAAQNDRRRENADDQRQRVPQRVEKRGIGQKVRIIVQYQRSGSADRADCSGGAKTTV